MRENTFYKIFQRHNLVKALGITSLALILLVGVVGASPFAYVTYDVNTNSLQYGAVSVIDIATKKVTATVPVEVDTGGVAATPDGNKLYVTNPSTNTISVIDTTTKKVTAKIDAGWKPYGVAVTPDGTKVYVTNEDDNSISVIDTATNTITATVDVGSDPKVVAVNPAGTELYVANRGDNTVSAVDIDTNTIIATIPVGYGPEGIAFSSDGTKVYVTNEDASSHDDYENEISEIDANSNIVVKTYYLPGGYPYGVAANPKGRWLYVSYYCPNNFDGFHAISVYDINKDHFYGYWDTFDSTLDKVVVTPDGKELYATIPNLNSVYVIDTVTGKAKAKIDIGNGNDIGMNEITIGPAATPVLPVADFSAKPISGKAPLKVTFTDKSTNNPTSWKWSFGDGTSSTTKNPTHQYSKAGKYTVKLTVKNAAGSDTETKTNYIKVIAKPVAAFSASPRSGKAPLSVKFTDKSTNSPTSWSWKFGDGSTSTDQNPKHKYSKAGKYTVSLTVKNSSGSDTKTISNYITVNSK